MAENGRVYRCPYCGRAFKSKGFLHRHMRKHQK